MLSRLFFFILCFPALLFAQENPEDLPDPQNDQPSEPVAAEVSKPSKAQSQGVAELRERFDAFFEKKPLSSAKVSVLIEHLPTKKLLYSRDPDRMLHPASNTKLATTAAALQLLGAAYTFDTDLAVDHLEQGVAGEAYFVGGGDSRLMDEHLWRLIEDAKDAGLKKIRGDLVVDESFFAGDHLPPGYGDKPDDDAAYRAATSAASLDFNAVKITVTPGKAGEAPKVSFQPGGGYIDLQNTAVTVQKGKEQLKISSKPHKDRTRILVSGQIPVNHRGVTVRKRIDNPPLFTGYAVKKALEKAGVTVGGKVRLGKAPQNRKRLARYSSDPVWRLVSDVNKFSNNFMAETLLRAISVKQGGDGKSVSGAAAVRQFLEKTVGITGVKYVNGSGLFGETSFSARQWVKLLRWVVESSAIAPEFLSSLAIGGQDGTLRKRLKGLPAGAVRAKTGTLDGVSCLSGYVTLGDGSQALFSILVNDLAGKAWNAWQAQDGMLEFLHQYKP